MYSFKVEYRHDGGVPYPDFTEAARDKRILGFCDLNTEKYLRALASDLKDAVNSIEILVIEEEEPIPDEALCARVTEAAQGADILLAAGSGTLNDVCKYISLNLSITCATLATAPSMDGYVSGVSALLRDGMKVTLNTRPPHWLLVDTSILASAPSVLIAAGIGDVVGKYNCLLDWRMAHLKNGEEINEDAVKTMLSAVDKCMGCLPMILNGDPGGAGALMDALITSGIAMVIAGNSRPASGGEHHTSHYLEMEFVRRGERIPLHGLKVALGTMVCIWLYNYLRDTGALFEGCEEVYREVEKLPTVAEIRGILKALKAPASYSEIGVEEALLADTIRNAYTVRQRYTVLTLTRELGLMETVIPMLVKEFL